MLSQQLLSQRIPWEGGARRPKGDGRREGSRGAAKETATPPRPRRAGGEYVFSITPTQTHAIADTTTLH